MKGAWVVAISPGEGRLLAYGAPITKDRSCVRVVDLETGLLYRLVFTSFCTAAQWGESFSKHLWFAIIIVFLAEMGRIPCCGRPESSSSNI